MAVYEVRATLLAVEGLDRDDYVETVLRRLATPALRHTTSQMAADGSVKLGPRLLGTVADALRSAVTPTVAARWR